MWRGSSGRVNDALVARAAEAKVLKLTKLRADTTVVEANVALTVDSSLLAKGIDRMVRLSKKLKGAGLATRTKMTDRTRSAHRRARMAVNTLRRKGELAKDELRRLNAALATMASATVKEAEAVVRNARRTLGQHPVGGKDLGYAGISPGVISNDTLAREAPAGLRWSACPDPVDGHRRHMPLGQDAR